MTLKDYLSQCVLLDQAINCKLEQLSELKQKAMNSKSFLEFSGGSAGTKSAVERTVEKIITFEEEINADIDRFVDIQQEITALIGTLSDMQQRIIMEKHYICGDKWDKIAEDMFLSLRTLMYLHKRALSNLESAYSGSGIA